MDTQWFSYFPDIPPYLGSQNPTAAFSKVGHGAAQASLSRGKQSSLSVFHIISLLAQIDSIWNIDKKP